MSSADLTLFAAPEAMAIDSRELCYASLQNTAKTRPISLTFLEEELPISTGAAAYSKIRMELPSVLAERVEVWGRSGPTDRVMIVRKLDPELVEHCLSFLNEKVNLDCRILIVVSTVSLPAQIQLACKLGFVHLPFYDKQSPKLSSAYAMSLMRDLLSDRARDSTPQLRSVSVVRTIQQRADGDDDSRTLLRSRGAPLRFTTPFVGAGFKLNSQLVREMADGVYVGTATKGTALYGPYLPVMPGRYQVLVQVRGEPVASSILSRLRSRASGLIAADAYLSGSDSVLQSVRVDAELLTDKPMQLELAFVVPELPELPKIELRIHQQSNKAFFVDFIELSWIEG